MKHQDLTAKIIECAYKVHNKLGFGFLESVYQNALMIELNKAGLSAEPQSPIKVFYEERIVGDFIADIIVEGKVILELKAVKELHPAHEAQVEGQLVRRTENAGHDLLGAKAQQRVVHSEGRPVLPLSANRS